MGEKVGANGRHNDAYLQVGADHLEDWNEAAHNKDEQLELGKQGEQQLVDTAQTNHHHHRDDGDGLQQQF